MIATRLRATSLDLTLVMKLYDRLNEFPIPSFVGKRMKLSCIAFKLSRVSASQNTSELVFRAQTTGLGIVNIRTEEDLSRLDSLYLIHPWIDFLLDRQPVGRVSEIIPEVTMNLDNQSSSLGELPPFPGPSDTILSAPQTRAARFVARLGRQFVGWPVISPGDAASLQPPSPVSEAGKQIRALQLIARLKQPFGALLFTPTRHNAAEYRRVASESMIIVQIEEITPTTLNKLLTA